MTNRVSVLQDYPNSRPEEKRDDLFVDEFKCSSYHPHHLVGFLHSVVDVLAEGQSVVYCDSGVFLCRRLFELRCLAIACLHCVRVFSKSLSYSHDLALVWVKFQHPFLRPCVQCVDVSL